MHVDIPRLREGKVGGFFWYAFSRVFRIWIHTNWVQVCIRVLCRQFNRGKGFFDRYVESAVCLSIVSLIELNPSSRFSDTLEQIDVAKGLIEKYPDVRLVSAHLSDQDLPCFRHLAMRSAREISSNPSHRGRLPACLVSRG